MSLASADADAAAAPQPHLSTRISTSSALVGWGDASGYHLDADVDGRASEIALLRPEGYDVASWTGYQCESGDGKYAAVTIAPTDAANSPSARAHGALAYSVDLVTGRVRALASGVSLVYYSPGCGTGDVAVFTSRTETNDESTTLSAANLAAGRITGSTTLPGQLTSAVPAMHALVAVRDGALVTVRGSSTRTIAKVGAAYDVVPSSDGGIDYLTLARGAATAWHEDRGELTRTGRGGDSATLVNGAGGHTVAVGLTIRAGADLVSSPAADGPVLGTSPDGRTMVVDRDSRTGKTLTFVDEGGRGRTVVSSATTKAPATTAVGPDIADAAFTAHPSVTPDVSPCAIPRNDPHVQALQPNAARVDWAIEQATANRLTGAYGRPSGFENMLDGSQPMPAYSANGDFPAIALSNPSGDGASTVPPLVFEAIAAQESNFLQASFHALPGIAGNPLVADYYGNGANSIDAIDYSKSDCGYGVVQVTTGMHTGDPDYGTAKQTKIAVDYEEDIAAGLNILENTWNQLTALGIIANNGSPADLENWYFAAWAYNTGIHPTGPDGTAGLGWANNPANPDYPPNRQPYLQQTYADAAHPADWPYQERIMGWMGSPLIQFGQKDYAAAAYRGGNAWLQIPPLGVACASTNYCTPPGGPGTAGCALSDDECWWTGHATWVTDCSSTCAVEPLPFISTAKSEPALSDPHPPTCSVDTGLLPTTSAVAPTIVDDLAPGRPLNVVGCPSSPGWKNNGSFDYSPGRNAAGQPVGEIDTHQLGAGFGGHIRFTHVESAADLINTGVWKPKLTKTEYYTVKVHVPSTGADDPAAVYTIDPAPGAQPTSITVNQAQGERWINLGVYALAPNATVTLTNRGKSGVGTVDVAFDAMAFIPEGGTPQIQVGSSCARVFFLGARGSSEKGPGTPGWIADKTNPLGLGTRIGPLEEDFAGDVKNNILAHSVIYPANNIIRAVDDLPNYTGNLEKGVTWGLADLRTQAAACSKQRIMLSGYSSGAMVIHRILADLAAGSAADKSILNRVDGVVLLADGDRHPGDTSINTGTAPTNSTGIAPAVAPGATKTPKGAFSKPVGARIHSVCDLDDPICDMITHTGIAEQIAFVAKHHKIHTTHYMSTAESAQYAKWLKGLLR